MPHTFQPLKNQLGLIANHILAAKKHTEEEDIVPVPFNGINTLDFTVSEQHPQLIISNSRQVVFREFAEDADAGPSTEDFMKRMQSLVEAARTLIPDEISDDEKQKILTSLSKLQNEFEIEINAYLVNNALYGIPLSKPANIRINLKADYEVMCESRDNLKECKEKLNNYANKDSQEYKNAAKDYQVALIDYQNNRKKYLKLVQSTFQDYAEHKLLPAIIKQIPKINSEEKDASALRRLRDAETQNITNKGRPILFNLYGVATPSKNAPHTSHFDMQLPIGYFTDEQCKLLGIAKDLKDTNSCYKRNDEGVSGLVIQATGHLENDVCIIDSAFVRHTSPVAIEIVDDEIRRSAVNGRNATQVAENLANVFIQTGAQATNKSVAEVAAQFQENPLEIPVVELRLLSVHSRKFDNLPGFRDQHQYLQILETYYAFNASGNKTFTASIHQNPEETPITFKAQLKPIVMSFGVNAVRGKLISDDLRAWINTRGFNELSDEFSNYLDNITTLTPKSKGEELRNLLKDCINPQVTIEERNSTKKIARVKKNILVSREDLEKSFHELNKIIQRYEAVIKRYPNESKRAEVIKSQYHEKIANIMKKVAGNHDLEKTLNSTREHLFKKDKKRLENCIKAIRAELNEQPITTEDKKKHQALKEFLINAENYMEIIRLKLDDNYFKPENNYLIQAHLGRLFEVLGYSVASGCNDDKDRGGRYACTRTTLDIFISQFGRPPIHSDKTDMANFNKILQSVLERSVNVNHAELTSAPGARGFQIFEGDGNPFNLENSGMAKLAKGIFEGAGQRMKEEKKDSDSVLSASGSHLQMEVLVEGQLLDESAQKIAHEQQKAEIKQSLNDFVRINLESVFLRNEKLAEGLLLTHWDDIHWFKGHALTVDKEDRAEAIHTFRKNYNEVYRAGIEQLIDIYAAPNNLQSLLENYNTKHKNYSDKDCFALTRVKNIQNINDDLEKESIPVKSSKYTPRSLLVSKNWENRSYVHGIHFGWKFWGAKRSEAVQVIDQLIDKYQMSKTAEDKASNLLELSEAIKEWNIYHKNVGKTSRRSGAVEELYAEVAKELQAIADNKLSSGNNSPHQ